MSRFMYVGPTIVGVATRNTTYEEAPAPLAAAIQTRPYLASLCVPLDQLSVAMTQMNKRQGGVFTLYKKALAESAEIQKGAI